MDSPLQLLTLNLFLRPPGIHTNYSDYKDLRTEVFIEDFLEKFDIICLQEVFGTFNKRKDRILKEAEKKGFFYLSASNPDWFKGHFIDSGLVILSKFEIVEKDEITFTQGKGVDGFCAKGVLYAKIKLFNGFLHVFTTHLQASYYTEDSQKFVEYRNVRKNQLIELKKFINKKVGDSEDPVIIAGDFNVDGRELGKQMRFNVKEEYKDFLEILSGGDRIIDVIREIYGESLATFAAVDQFGCPTETVLTGVDECCQDECLDYILVKCPKKLIIDEDLTRVEKLSVKSLPITQLSDHLGIVFVFRLK